MTKIKPNDMNDSDDEEFQASSEDIDIKPWDLPYWKGTPKKDESDINAEEAEQLEEVELVEPLTVEDIEKIRNEAYEEGFLQGLNEGRDKGEKEGREQGIALGKAEGLKQGQQEGNRIGFEAGEAEGLASGKQHIEQAATQLFQLSEQLQHSLIDKDAAIPQVISQLIQSACQKILERELEQGDNQITQKVIRALKELPAGAENIQIFVSSADALHLEHGLSSSGREMHFDVDETLETGSARITTQQSLIEFSHKERMDKIFDLVESECEKLDLEDVLDKQAVESDNAEALKFDSLDNEEDAV
jgi:flagellar assembly protein FliH